MKNKILKVMTLFNYFMAVWMVGAIGYSLGSANKGTESYKAGIEDVKKELTVAVEDGTPFSFGGLTFLPLRGNPDIREEPNTALVKEGTCK